MQNISGSHIIPGKNVGGQQNQDRQVPVSPRGRLEDLLNDLISLDDPSQASPDATPVSVTASQAPPPPQPDAKPNSSVPRVLNDFSFSQAKLTPPKKHSPEAPKYPASGRKQLPPELRSELKLPLAVDATYSALKVFHQTNRHSPYLELSCGSIAYIEYDVETERVRVFLGHKREFTIFPRGIREQSGILVINEVFEYKVETTTREVFGFTKKEHAVLEKHRLGSELLRGNDLIPGRAVYAVLHFSAFADKSCGISSCSVKAECFNR